MAVGGDVVAALGDQQAELAAAIAPLDEQGFATASRCAGWTIADVMLHLAQTNEMAIASCEGRLDRYLADALHQIDPASGVEDGAGALVAAERGASGSEVAQRWRRSADTQVAAFAALDPQARLQWVAGELAARSLATTRLTECWIHTMDVADGLGVSVAPTDRLWHTVRLVWRTLPYAVALAGSQLAGPVVFEIESPTGEPWRFGDDDHPITVVRGGVLELCEVAGQRRAAADTSLDGEGPDLALILGVIRTFA